MGGASRPARVCRHVALQLQNRAARLQHHLGPGWRKPSKWSCTVCARSRAGMSWPRVWGAALMEPLARLEMPMRAPRQPLIHFSQGHQAFELVLPYFTRKGPKSRESLRPEVDAACRAGSVPPSPHSSVGEHGHHHHFRLGAGTSLPLQAPAGRHPHPTQWPGTGMLGSRPSPPWA